jgi:MFS family permease
VDSSIRGRVLALRMAVALGGTPIGSPIVGWVADHFGPRWSMGVGVLAGVIATMIGLTYWLRHREVEGASSPAE